MERKNIRIRRDELLRLKFLKKEYTIIILKSVIHTRSISPLVRFHAYTRLNKHTHYISRWKNYCILTGRGKGVYSMFSVSRHVINKLGQQGYLSGFTRNNHR